MPELNWKTTVLLCVLIGTATYAHSVRHPETLPPPVVTEQQDSWVLRRIQACDDVCGPVPFTVEGTRDSIKCHCDRPGNLGTFPVPKVPKVGKNAVAVTP